MSPSQVGQGAVVVGCGGALPEKVVTNADFEARMETSDAWIVERTGIRERRVGGTVVSLATSAAQAALAQAGVDPGSIDILVVSTSSAPEYFPAVSAQVANACGLPGHVAAFDLNAACTGFTYAMIVAHSLLGGSRRRALVIGSDTITNLADQNDRRTAVLFGDGAGAVILEAVEDPTCRLTFDSGTDGSLGSILRCDVGGHIEMSGQEVFRRAVRVSVDSVAAAIKEAGLTADEIDLFVPHQANIRIIEAVCQRVGLSMNSTHVILDRTGNTSSASIPLALADAQSSGRLVGGEKVLISGFGAGMTWASMVFRWGRP